ncbi:MAG: hypothetical protein JWR24_295 [Actinoallomurus sp.]|jgi:hypothetical protein|nr:hypothetical protein [Actinoallomurus sp.]
MNTSADPPGQRLARRRARREKSLDVVPLSDSALWFEARLRDSGTELVDQRNVDVIHALRLEGLITLPDLVIRAVRGHADVQPYDHCALSLAPIQKLAGLSLTRGYRREVLAVMGGTLGCSHFLTLALELSGANILSVYLRMRPHVAYTVDARKDGSWTDVALQVAPQLEGACLGLASDSPVIAKVRRR